MNEAPRAPAREAAPLKPRRVYKSAGVGDATAGTYAVLLDGKPARTPSRAPLASAKKSLASAVAAEWDAQNPHVDPETMPLTRLLATEIDRVTPHRAAVIDSLLSYVDADCTCYRAPHPADLRQRQQRRWGPVLDWLAREQGIVLTTVEGAMPASQTPEVAARVRSALESLTVSELTAFQAAAALTTSLALSFALVHRRLTASETFEAAFLDELFQAEKWGEDGEAAARRRRIAADIAAIERYLEFCA